MSAARAAAFKTAGYPPVGEVRAAAVADSGGLPLEVEGEEAFEDLGVGEVEGPAVGGEDGGVECQVNVLEPGRALVVEVRRVRFSSAAGSSPEGLSQPSRSSTSRRAASAIASRCSSVGRGNGKVSKVVVGV